MSYFAKTAQFRHTIEGFIKPTLNQLDDAKCHAFYRQKNGLEWRTQTDANLNIENYLYAEERQRAVANKFSYGYSLYLSDSRSSTYDGKSKRETAIKDACLHKINEGKTDGLSKAVNKELNKDLYEAYQTAMSRASECKNSIKTKEKLKTDTTADNEELKRLKKGGTTLYPFTHS